MTALPWGYLSRASPWGIGGGTSTDRIMRILVDKRMSTHRSSPLSPQVRKWARRLVSRPTVLGIAAALYTSSAGCAVLLLQAVPVVRVGGFDLGSLIPLVIGSWAVVSVLLLVLAATRGWGHPGLRDRTGSPP